MYMYFTLIKKRNNIYIIQKYFRDSIITAIINFNIIQNLGRNRSYKFGESNESTKSVIADCSSVLFAFSLTPMQTWLGVAR
jgi:hypothetical protein